MVVCTFVTQGWDAGRGQVDPWGLMTIEEDTRLLLKKLCVIGWGIQCEGQDSSGVILFFYLYMASKDLTQVLRLVRPGRELYPLSCMLCPCTRVCKMLF